jgi:pimeloyl-ACP methyl ester carboxylesterase
MINPILNFKILGEGEPLLVIHGLFGSSRNWQSLSQQLAKRYQVITLDLRNHGDSFHDDEMNYSVMTKDVEILMDHLKIDVAHVLGHSMGGKVAMTLSSLNPDRVKKLIVADIAPVSYSHSYDNLIQPILDLDLSSVSRRKEVDERLSGSIKEQGIRLFLLQNLAFSDGKAYWKLNWSVLNDSLPAVTSFFDISDWNIPHECLFIRGGQSDYVSDDNWQFLKPHFPRAQLSTLENAGHWLHAEQPEAFYQSVSDFLTQ